VNTPAPVGVGRLSQRAVITALLEDDFVWDAADELDQLAMGDLHPGRGGRPRAYPLACAVIWDALVSVFGSSRQVEVELGCADSGWWNLIQTAAARKRPGLQIPDLPMRRHHYQYLRNRYLTAHPEQLHALTRAFTAHAARLAVRVGLCDPGGGGSYTHPCPDRVVAGDGKVLTPRYTTHPKQRRKVSKTTGEVRYRKADPDADIHVTGGGERAFGTKYVFLTTRGDARNQRIILSVAHCPSVGGESRTALRAFDSTLPLLPGAQAAVYDGALRGTHLHHLLTHHGIIPVARVPRAVSGVPRDRHLHGATVHRDGGDQGQVEIHLREGAPHVRQLAVDGTPILHPLRRTRILRRCDRTQWRLYAEYSVPDSLGGGTVRLRLDRTAHDVATGFNREEHLRPIPPRDPDHQRLYARRNDTESGNRLLDDSMLRERAHTVGWQRQLFNLTTWAAVGNATANRQHARSAPHPPPALAA
jgi:hypothetical protein